MLVNLFQFNNQSCGDLLFPVWYWRRTKITARLKVSTSNKKVIQRLIYSCFFRNNSYINIDISTFLNIIQILLELNPKQPLFSITMTMMIMTLMTSMMTSFSSMMATTKLTATTVATMKIETSSVKEKKRIKAV